ncbi:hypothetical protein RDI58_018339 [Solanum bulbocastanum]|uniref:Reverse transcriptase zinc-binding domain-containing protein n=1 Tax=Solanum bulbocastanum TaxID=147425 RepID=A0AAN8Y9N6_SOLBU
MRWKGLMFNNAARPKVIITLWLQLQGRLMTVDRLASWGMNVDHQCRLCAVANESRDHLIVHWLYSQQLWERLLQWLHLQVFTMASSSGFHCHGLETSSQLDNNEYQGENTECSTYQNHLYINCSPHLDREELKDF